MINWLLEIKLVSIPKTVDKAAEAFINNLQKDDIEFIKNVSREDGFYLGISMGRTIRNSFGLWNGNEELIKDSNETHPDDVSSIILDKIWEKLNPEDITKRKDWANSTLPFKWSFKSECEKK